MREQVIFALSVSSGSVLIAMVALLLNYRGFVSIDRRFTSIERRLDAMQAGIKRLNRCAAALRIDVALLKNNAGV